MAPEDGSSVLHVLLRMASLTSSQLWVALAIMIAESIISLLPIVLSYAITLVRYRRHTSSRLKLFQPVSPRESNVTTNDYFDPADDEDDDPEHEPPERLVPMSWVWWGLGLSGVSGVILVWVVFGADGIHPWATAVGLVLASALSLIGVRALGETDINPVRPLKTKIILGLADGRKGVGNR
jgi:hypothetical protein